VIVDVAILPAMARDVAGKICVVVDVLRPSTTLSYMARAGARTAAITSDPPSARQLAARIGTAVLLCGEAGGVKPDDFDLGNSPTAYTPDIVAGRDLVFCSSNGAKALHLLDRCPVRLVGAFVNATSVARAAMDLARSRKLDISIVCAGEQRCERFSLEDMVGAGMIADRVLQTADGLVVPDESAVAAMRLFRSYLPAVTANAESVATAAMFADSQAARILTGLGFGADVEECGRVDVVRQVVRVTETDGRLFASPLDSRTGDAD
jgi:2-phosphosulfolactate phosphatase